MEVCPSCGYYVDRLSTMTGWCRSCSKDSESELERFLIDNADGIEHYMLQGNSLALSITKLATAQRPTCACCGGVIKGGGRNSVFCRKLPECKRASKRYVYLYTHKGMTKSQALATILQSINGSD